MCACACVRASERPCVRASERACVRASGVTVLGPCSLGRRPHPQQAATQQAATQQATTQQAATQQGVAAPDETSCSTKPTPAAAPADAEGGASDHAEGSGGNSRNRSALRSVRFGSAASSHDETEAGSGRSGRSVRSAATRGEREPTPPKAEPGDA